MTDLIDLNYHRNKIFSNRSSSSRNSLQQSSSSKIYCIDQVIQKFFNKIDKINIKTIETYVFELDKTKVLFRQIYYYYPIRIIGVISLGNGIFSLRIQFFDQKGTKICAKSLHHRTVVSAFAYEVNAELQNFKLECHPMSGQFSFVFNIKAQYLDRALVSELIQFALDSYFEECQGHFYVLHLIQYLDRSKNQYIKTIEKDFIFLRQWIMERSQENRASFKDHSFYKKLPKKQQNFLLENQIQKNPPFRHTSKIKMIEKYLYPNEDKLFIERQLCSYRTRQTFKRFKKYYNEQSIIHLFLTSKAKHQNIVNVKPKQTKTLQEFMMGKSVIKEKQTNENNKFQFIIQKSFNSTEFNHNTSEDINFEVKSESSQNYDQVVRIWDKNSGKCYIVKILSLKSSAKNENFFVQKLCKIESYHFINQYINLENYAMQNEFILVNIHPKRIQLSDFMKKNNKIISLSSRINICINLVHIVFTLHLKNKIQNYFPHISLWNIEISRKQSLSFRTLSFLSVFPLYELINTISMIIFETPLTIFKRDHTVRDKLVKGDEVENKVWGLSVCIDFLRYYLFGIYEDAVNIIKLDDLKVNKITTSIENKELDQWKKNKLTRTCEQLLVIFGHYQNISSRGFQERYQLGEISDSEGDEISDSSDSESST